MTSDTQALTINIEGTGKVSSQAKLIALSGKTPNATNSITHPDAVVPVERNIVVPRPKFEQHFAPYSISVLDLSY